jgi:ATP-dependent RNA helicase RhlE
MSHRPQCRCRKGSATVLSWKDYSLNSFNGFGLAEPILTALTEERYVTPTPIQAQSIPVLLSGRDLIGIAQTGTGKTAAFALPILHRLLATRRRPEKKTCRILVLSPTRELSGQILASFRAYGRHVTIDTALAIGGVSMGAQVRALAGGVDVLVATPGRLIDLVRSNALRLSGVETFVLDEADRMLDMGFVHDVRAIVAKLPHERQTLLFSATMPQAIVQLAGEMLRNPATVTVSPSASTVPRVAQSIVHVDQQAKPSLLAEILRGDTIDRALVFTRTKRGADRVVRGLVSKGFDAAAIHGNKSQNQRERVLAAFRDGRVRTLIATDIAARGLDIEGVTHVINFDLPNIPEGYVHRIGRTARAGAAGTAISLCSADEVPFLRAIEKLTRMSIPATGSATDFRSGQRSTDPPQSCHQNGMRSARQRPAPQPQNRRATESRRNSGPPGRHPQNLAMPADGIGVVAFIQRNPEPRRQRRRQGAHEQPQQ